MLPLRTGEISFARPSQICMSWPRMLDGRFARGPRREAPQQVRIGVCERHVSVTLPPATTK
jgi:hypothetical protein